MTFTRGPWKIGATVDGYGTAVVSATEAQWYQSAGGMVPLLICSMAARSKDAYPEMGANAALIAASPDLLAACEALMADNGTGSGEPARAQARAAIAKARAQSENVT